jgi:hypothetical protein
MPKFVKIRPRLHLICLAVAGGLIWLIQRLSAQRQGRSRNPLPTCAN